MKFKLRSLGVQLTLSFVLLIFFVATFNFVYTLKATRKALKEQVRAELSALSALMALELNGVDGDALKQLKPGDENSREYQRLKDKLKFFQSAHSDIKYVYTMKRDGDTLRFIIDPMFGDPDDPGAAIDEQYEETNPLMLSGFEKTTTETDYYSDKWGTFLSGYSPVRDSNQQIVAIVGVDISAATIFKKQHYIGRTIYWILAGSVALAAMIIFLFSVTIIRDVHVLIQAANDISTGKTDVEIKIRRKDEIGELAQSFARMVASLKIMMQK